MRWTRLDRGFRALPVLAGALAFGWGSAALAQTSDGSLIIPGGIDVRGRGWSQIANIDEMLDFGVALIETAVLAAVLAFHPVNIGFRAQPDAVELRKGMFIFALIGMLTGFLVVHHGYLIGFVIFGIGGLFRFRMESSSISDTGQLVLVSLVGLAAGLDLPVMALIATLAAWIVIYTVGTSRRLVLEVKFAGKTVDPDAMQRLQAHLVDKGFTVVSVSKAKFKPTVNLVLSRRGAQAQDLLVREMSGLHALPDSDIADWHID
ncbi:hypothetical protein ACQ5SP_08380 [Rhodovulum sp. YNF3179]|uniref:hypothetical protein n=1 Tax=Rhodovulum sp. YNF3179 TaxID=3425127 RepID=UPI003D33AB2E